MTFRILGLFRETSDFKSRQIDNKIMEMVATENLSFSFVDSIGFRNLLKLIDARYNLR